MGWNVTMPKDAQERAKALGSPLVILGVLWPGAFRSEYLIHDASESSLKEMIQLLEQIPWQVREGRKRTQPIPTDDEQRGRRFDERG